MSLSGALNNAASGLAINARSAGVVSSNISNTLTEGYGRRELLVTSESIASFGGVRSVGILRHSNPVLVSDRRQAEALAAQSQTLVTAAQAIESLVGSPLDGDSLSGRLAAFESGLITAASDPSSQLRLTGVSQAGEDLVNKINHISDGIQSLREQAEAGIATLVDDLNVGLERVADLNTQISGLIAKGRDTSALLDARQLEIDTIATIVPVHVREGEHGFVSLVTHGGELLLDYTPPKIEFSQSNVIAPHMTFGSGLLSGLTINGRPITPGNDGPFAGGKLAAQFQIRDVESVDVQAAMDGMARDLVERFGFGGPDTTLASGDPGFFTDSGSAFLSTDETGLAGRLQLNSAIDPELGESWRLRDGLNASLSGSVGDAKLIQGWHDALTNRQVAGSLQLTNASVSFASHATYVSSLAGDARVDAEKELAFAMSSAVSIRTEELAGGVDSDAELQHLMQIEQAYAANAQVIRVIDELMQLLLR